MRREFVRIPYAEIFAGVSVAFMLWAFTMIPWIKTEGATGWQHLTSSPLFSVETALGTMWFLPLIIVVAGIATVVGLVRAEYRLQAASAIALAGVAGLVYYILFMSGNATKQISFVEHGFWKVFLGVLGLLVQLVIPRTVEQSQEAARIPLGEVIAFIAVLLMIWAFQQVPWTSAGNATGRQILENAPAIMEVGISSIWLFPITIAIAGAATAIGLVRPKDRQTTSIITALVALFGLIYYAVYIGFNDLDFTGMWQQGFWLSLVAMVLLLIQYIIPRTPIQVSIFDVNWWRLLPFDVDLQRREWVAAYLFLTPFLIFFGIFVVRAVILAVRMSFFNWLILPPTEDYIGMANYVELLNDAVWWTALQNTFIFAAITVVGTTILSLLAALAVIQPVRGQEFFRVLLYMPQLLSVGAVGLIWVWLMNTQFGVINYGLSFFGLRPINWLGDPNLVLPSLSFTTIWWTFGFPMLIFIAGLQGIPEQLYEAARIDGANPRQIFFNITLPLLRPTILFVTVTGVIGHFQVYGQPFIMTNGGPGRSSYTVIFYLWQIAWTAFRMGYGAAVAVVIAIIMATMTIIQFFFIGRRVQF